LDKYDPDHKKKSRPSSSGEPGRRLEPVIFVWKQRVDLIAHSVVPIANFNRGSQLQAGIAEGNCSASKKDLSERDICTKFINPALTQAGWDLLSQVREEVAFTKGRIIVRGKLVTRGKAKRADYILYYKPNIPIALIEAKDNCHSVGDVITSRISTELLNLPGSKDYASILKK